MKQFVHRGGLPGEDGKSRLAKLRAAATPAGKAYSEGLARKKEKKWPEAIKAFQNCVALDANHSKAWFWLGQSYYLQNGSKNCEASYEPYTRCIALDPKHAEAHLNLGNLLKTVRKDYDGAEKMYRKAIELNPKFTSPLWNLSLILEDQKNDIPGAIKAVEEYIRRDDPDNDGDNINSTRTSLRTTRASLCTAKTPNGGRT